MKLRPNKKKMKVKINVKKVDLEAGQYFSRLKAENLIDRRDHDMIIFTRDGEFRLASSSLVRLSENPKNILRAYRIDSLGNLWVT